MDGMCDAKRYEKFYL